MPGRILYDGLNLSLKTGTGIATYTRNLARQARALGHRISVAYSLQNPPPEDPKLREALLFEEKARRRTWLEKRTSEIKAHSPLGGTVPLLRTTPSGTVDVSVYRDRLPDYDDLYVGHRVFDHAREQFGAMNRFTRLTIDERPDVAHFTFPLPLKVAGAANLYTIHDLVPLKLPFATLDHREYFYRLHRRIAQDADHIVTVSETSRRDIVEILGVPEHRVTNTYQAVSIPEDLLARPRDAVADEIDALHGLEYGRYFLFFGAIEPKKNVRRLLEAYLTARPGLPLVVVSSSGWQNEAETAILSDPRFAPGGGGPEIRRLSYVGYRQLVSLIRGARAVTFPSLYEGFGLPVLEAMALGTPVLTSSTSCLPEIAGDAAYLVDPMDVDSIAAGFRVLAADDDLCADLAARGPARAARFSPDNYRHEVRALYARFT